MSRCISADIDASRLTVSKLHSCVALQAVCRGVIASAIAQITKGLAYSCDVLLRR